MLIAEFDLQREDVFAVALEAEVTWFDHAGVNGADGNLVNLFAADFEVVGEAKNGTEVLELVREVPAQSDTGEASRAGVETGDEVVLVDVVGSPEVTAVPPADPGGVLSKYRIVFRATAPGNGEDDADRDETSAIVSTSTPQDSRVRLLSGF